MTVDSASGTTGCHQIECAEPSPSECVKIASVYTPLLAAEGSTFRKNGGNIEHPETVTVENSLGALLPIHPQELGCSETVSTRIIHHPSHGLVSENTQTPTGAARRSCKRRQYGGGSVVGSSLRICHAPRGSWFCQGGS